MRYRIPALLAVLACALACHKTPQPKELPFENLYTGTVSVDYENEVFDNEGITVACIPSADGQSAEIIIYKIKFVPKMPVRIDVTIPGVSLLSADSGLRLSCDDVVPLALGGEYPKYRVHNLQGSLSGKTLSFSLLFGDYPTRFTGTRK